MNKSKNTIFMEALENIEKAKSLLCEMQENSDILETQIEEDDQVINDPESTDNSGNEYDLLNSLNKIFTPILVMQGFEDGVSDKIQESLSESCMLTEQNIIQFDNSTRFAQLISTCALLIEQQKNSSEYQTYKKASELKNTAKLNIQKKNYEQAKALAQKFLVKVSTTNNSSVARQAANDLLPETQH